MARDIFVFLVILVAAFLFERSGILRTAKVVSAAVQKNYLVFRDPAISDHWKEIFLLKNSQRSFLASLKLSFQILVFLAVILVPLLFYNWIAPRDEVFAYLMTIRGIVMTILPFLAFFFLRKYWPGHKTHQS